MKYTIIAYSNFDKKKVEYTIMFDSITGATESYTNQITQFTVEDGGFINDHAVKAKDKINIEGIVTDLSFNQGEAGLVMFNAVGGIEVSLSESWSKKIKLALLDINEKILPCSVKISDRINGEEIIDSETYPCLIESLNLDVVNGQYGFIQPKIVFVPVRIARLEFTKLTASQEAIPELKNQQAAANAAKGTSGSTGGGAGDGKGDDGKIVGLDLTTTPAEQTSENKSMIGEISKKSKKMADIWLSGEKKIAQAELDRLEKKEAGLK